MRDLVKCALQNLTRKRSRSLLTILSIGVSVASVVLISSIGTMGTQMVNQEINSLGIGALTVSVDGMAKSSIALKKEHLDFLRSQPGVEDAVPILAEKGTVEMKNCSFDGMVWGIDAGANQIFHLDLQFGRLLREADITSAQKVCLVEETLAQEIYHRDNIVGKTMRITLDGKQETFEVIGVVASGGNLLQGIIGEYVPSFIYLPYSCMQTTSTNAGFDQIAIQLEEGTEVEGFAQRIRTQLDEREGRTGAFATQNIAQQKDKLNHIMSLVSGILAVIAGISIVVAGLGIMTVMLASVGERTREIGIKKSIGATKGNIVQEFLVEALALSCIGSIAGTLAGLGIAWVGCALGKIDFSFDGKMIQAVFLFAVANGLVFGVYPSVKAANLDPVEALRHQA